MTTDTSDSTCDRYTIKKKKKKKRKERRVCTFNAISALFAKKLV
jgi:hypothetical protein